MFLGRPMTIISLSRGNKQPAGDVIANVRVAGVLCDITKGQHCATRDHAGVCRRSASQDFSLFFPSPSSCDSCARKLFSSTHLHFCCLLNKDQCHSALTAGAPTRLPWPSGEQIQNPSIVLRRGGGVGATERGESSRLFVPRSAARSSR